MQAISRSIDWNTSNAAYDGWQLPPESSGDDSVEMPTPVEIGWRCRVEMPTPYSNKINTKNIR